MFTDVNRKELEQNGYTVVERVAPARLCDECIFQYDSWLANFVKNGDWPFSFNGFIQRYKIGHYEPSWKLRLACKPVFAKLWGTEKLLTSIDEVAIGRAPENGQETFYRPGHHCLQCDQPGNQTGLHLFQGSLYLEATDVDDWTFSAMKGSHRLIDEFYRSHSAAMMKSMVDHCYHLNDSDVIWFLNKGCRLKRIPVPKGGLVLWDSRTVHTNLRPLHDRKHPGRILRTVSVCMAPAVWATDADLEIKKIAYDKVLMTDHRPSQNVQLFLEHVPEKYKNLPATNKLPDIAKPEEAQRLCGVLPYNFKDGEPNGPDWLPEWIGGNR